MIWLILAAGGALGALSRYMVTLWMGRLTQPYYVATFIVNSLGSFLMGLALHIATDQQLLSAFFAIGFLGAFTTFSTFAFDTVRLMQEGNHRGVFLYPALTLLAGIAFVTFGWQIG
ncbi:fluoride efflux transporter FluC [Rummeliibacillus sp. BSL5]